MAKNRRVRIRNEEPVKRARHYAELKDREKRAEAARKDAADPLLAYMQDEGFDKIKVPDFDENTSATVSIKERENAKINEDRLKKALGSRTFNKVSTPTLDEAKLEAAIALGDVDPNVVASCMEKNPTKFLDVRFNKRKKTS